VSRGMCPMGLYRSLLGQISDVSCAYPQFPVSRVRPSHTTELRNQREE
jgi:hypothetical protein